MNTLRRRIMPVEGIDYSKQYLTIVSLADNNNIIWNGSSSSSSSQRYISYSTDGGVTWSNAYSNYTVPTILATLNTGEKLMLRYYNTDAYASSTSYYSYFSSTQNFDLEGNIMSLTTSGDFTTATVINSNYAFFRLFYNCTKLKSTENLVLPATTLAQHCYRALFYQCSGMTKAPKTLPATTLKSYCYYYMFSGCSSLIQAPDLPAKTLVTNCYQNMFSSCGKLNYIKCLATNISASNCTTSWLNKVSESGTFVKASSMTSWTTGANGIPTGWIAEDYVPTTYIIVITLTGDSVEGITITLTDSDGISHSGTTDSNGVVQLTDVVGGDAKVSASVNGYILTNSSITVNASRKSFTCRLVPLGIWAYYADGTLKSEEEADSNAIGVAVITTKCGFVIDKQFANNGNGVYFGGINKNLKNIGVAHPGNSETAETNYDGEGNTTKLINALKGYTDTAGVVGAQAAEACRAAFNGRGYLPAAGELYQMYYQQWLKVNSMMTKIGSTINVNNMTVWTSTLYDDDYESWFYSNGLTRYASRSNPLQVLAFRAL